MKSVSFFDAKPYDKEFFEEERKKYPDVEIIYHEEKLNRKTAVFAKGSDVVCAFVNDDIGEDTLAVLDAQGIHMIAMRCAGYNNIDFKYAYGKIHVARVPAYSPYAVAEHAMAMLLTLNRKLHRAYNRVREYNFSLNGLTGFDLHGKTVGIVGTGKIGRTFLDICKGFGMNILAYDLYPVKDSDIHYVTLDELFEQSDIISLHCPLSKETHHMIDASAIDKMKEGVFLINTSRGALIDSEALVEGIKEKKIGAAALDVYEEEADLFYEDNSNTIVQDDTIARLISMPNVLITSHQAFLTKEALSNIAATTMKNIDEYLKGEFMENEICYHCTKDKVACSHQNGKRCF